MRQACERRRWEVPRRRGGRRCWTVLRRIPRPRAPCHSTTRSLLLASLTLTALTASTVSAALLAFYSRDRGGHALAARDRPRSRPRFTAYWCRRAGSGRRRDDLTPVIGAAGRTGDVRELHVMALRALHQSRRRGLPLRTTVPRVAARLFPLRDGHFSPPGFLLVVPIGPAAPPTGRRRRRCGDGPGRRRPASHHTPSTGRDSRPGTAGTAAAPRPPRP